MNNFLASASAFKCLALSLCFWTFYLPQAQAEELGIDLRFQWQANNITEHNFLQGVCPENVADAIGMLCTISWHRTSNGQTIVFTPLLDSNYLLLIIEETTIFTGVSDGRVFTFKDLSGSQISGYNSYRNTFCTYTSTSATAFRWDGLAYQIDRIFSDLCPR